jgi:hypothetical protein
MRHLYHIHPLTKEERHSVCRDMQMLCIYHTSRKLKDGTYVVEFAAEDWQLQRLKKCL